MVGFICHIENDVRWFVRAVGNYERWFENAVGNRERWCEENASFPPDIIVAYLDSALLHGRTLAEFFGHTNSKRDPVHSDVRACHYLLTSDSFPCGKSGSSDLRKWKEAADNYLAHLTTNRGAGYDSNIVTQVPHPVEREGGLNKWKLLDLWQRHLRPGFEQLVNEALTCEMRSKFKELLDRADCFLEEGLRWNPPSRRSGS
jgi:hypothetical protein